MSFLTNNDLERWFQANLNILLISDPGVGKTESVKSFLNDKFGENSHGIKWLYFSASTLDPWVDFVGIPKEKTNEDGIAYIETVLPKAFAMENIEFIMIDELNRAHPKIHNALLELIQFKSINGHPFVGLKHIWGAMNPFDPSKAKQKFQVTELDPAFLDRFHVHYELDYDLNMHYMRNKYGVERANAVKEWWGALPIELRKAGVSPRRVEYAINYVLDHNGPAKDILPQSAMPAEFTKKLIDGPLINTIKNLLDKERTEEENSQLKELLTQNFDSFKKTIFNSLMPEHQKEIIKEQILHDELYNDLIVTNSVAQSNFVLLAKSLTNSDDLTKEKIESSRILSTIYRMSKANTCDVVLRQLDKENLDLIKQIMDKETDSFDFFTKEVDMISKQPANTTTQRKELIHNSFKLLNSIAVEYINVIETKEINDSLFESLTNLLNHLRVETNNSALNRINAATYKKLEEYLLEKEGSKADFDEKLKNITTLYSYYYYIYNKIHGLNNNPNNSSKYISEFLMPFAFLGEYVKKEFKFNSTIPLCNDSGHYVNPFTNEVKELNTNGLNVLA